MTLSLLESLVGFSPNSNIADKVICLYRDPLNSGSYYEDLLSPFIADGLLQKSEFGSLDTKRQLFELFTGVPESAVAGDRLFKWYMHDRLSVASGNLPLISSQLHCTSGTLKLASYEVLTTSKSLPFPYQPTERRVKRFNPFNKSRIHPLSHNVYWISSVSDTLCFDSFSEAVFIFKITITNTPEINSGTRKEFSLLRKLLPSHLVVPWHYVLVVPRDRNNRAKLTFVSQTWTNTITSFQVLSEEGDERQHILWMDHTGSGDDEPVDDADFPIIESEDEDEEKESMDI